MNNTDMKYAITVIVPVLNEEKHIRSFLDTLLCQDYPKSRMEILFADGGSEDRTVSIIKEMMKTAPDIFYRILKNRGRTAPHAMNLGIQAASGEIIVRMDAHTEYPMNYISKCVHYLTASDADNVGCPFFVHGEGLIGECIEKVLTSSFGVGGSDFRKGKEFCSDEKRTEYVDTVPFGTFRKELALRLGGFDERYPRAEDNDFNYRIRKAGGRILLFRDIHTVYHCRSSVRELIRMGYGNGESVGAVIWKDPRTVGIRHIVPLGFVLSLLLGALGRKNSFIRKAAGAELTVYGLACVTAALRAHAGTLKTFVIIPLFPLLHISYGIGTAIGLVKGLRNALMRDRHDRS